MRELIQGRRAVIPCWVSDPSVEVHFLKDSYLPEDQDPLGPEDGVIWDPRQGFIIENPNKNFDGLHKCTTDTASVNFVFFISCK